MQTHVFILSWSTISTSVVTESANPCLYSVRKHSNYSSHQKMGTLTARMSLATLSSNFVSSASSSRKMTFSTKERWRKCLPRQLLSSRMLYRSLARTSNWSQSFSDKTWHTPATDHSLFLAKHDTQQLLITVFFWLKNDTQQLLITVFFWQNMTHTSNSSQSFSDKTGHTAAADHSLFMTKNDTPATDHSLFLTKKLHTAVADHSLFLKKHDTQQLQITVFFWQNMTHSSCGSQSFPGKTWHTPATDHSLFLAKHDTQQLLITVFFWQNATHSSCWSQSFYDKTWHTSNWSQSFSDETYDTQQQLITFSDNDTHQQLTTVIFWKWHTPATDQSFSDKNDVHPQLISLLLTKHNTPQQLVMVFSDKTWHTSATDHILLLTVFIWQNMTH